MKILFDTHLLLWAAGDSGRLPKRAKNRLEDPRTEPLFSAASLWEITIKRGLGREDFQVDPRRLRRGLLDHGKRGRRTRLQRRHSGDAELFRDPGDYGE